MTRSHVWAPRSGQPCGSDTCDFPALAYQTFMKAECEAFHSGVDALKDEWWDESLTAPKDEAKAEAEVSTPTSKNGHHREGKPNMSFPR